MTLKYVLKSLRRRKIRTILMLLALIVGVGALVALNATVDTYERFYLATVSNSAGDFDLVITKNETQADLLIDEHIILAIQDRAPLAQSVVPRIQGVVDVDVLDEVGSPIHGSAKFVALDAELDELGAFEVISGTINLAPGYAVILQETADTFALEPGDTLDIGYALPLPRQTGVESASDISTRQAKTTLTVSGIALQRGVTGEESNDGVLIDLRFAQNWLDIPGFSERIVVAYDEAIYNNGDPQAAAFEARALSENIRNGLGDIYEYDLPRATVLSNTAEAFIFIQALISIYGLLSLGVVGLLVRTMVMTNVREQTRDLALFRVLGAPRRYLFTLVAVEVTTLGVMGIGLGALAGQAVTNFIIAPLISELANIPLTDVPLVSPRALFLSVGTAAVVLVISAYTPARRAASTKIMYAINPGVAEGIGLDELAKLRERKVNFKIFWAGLVTLFYPALIFFAFPLAFTFGVLWLQAALIFGSLMLLILGTSLLFFPITLPAERLLIGLLGLFSGKVGYFARRNVVRGSNRNTLISLMIVISATLPTFFATTLALDRANITTDQHLSNGTPLVIRKSGAVQVQTQNDDNGPGRRDDNTPSEVKNRFDDKLKAQLRADGSLGPNVAVTHRFDTRLRDSVGLRKVGIRVYGLDSNLAEISYPEGIEWIAGSLTSFDQLQNNPNTVIISEGLSEYFERGLGDTLYLKGEGLDHIRPVEIVGVLGRFSGFDGFTSKRTRAEEGRTELFLNETAFREVTRDPLDGPYDPTYPITERLMAAPNMRSGLLNLPDEVGLAAIAQVAANIRQQYGLSEKVTVRSTPENIESAQAGALQVQVVILVLTAISFLLAVFGVFVVTYISVYTRRSEIAMLKAIGDSNRHLFGMFLSESLIMTLSATLTGILAGIVLGYVFRYANSFTREIPTVPAMDQVVTLTMLVMMILAALISTLFATWGYLRRKAIEIMRMI